MRTKTLSQIDKNICVNIKKYMDKLGITQNEMAVIMHSSQSAVSRFINCQCTPTDEQLVILCEYFHISLYDIFGVKDPNEVSDREKRILQEIRKNPAKMDLVEKDLLIK